jgi:aconitate hydratase
LQTEAPPRNTWSWRTEFPSARSDRWSYADGENAESLGLTGEEEYSITGVDGGEAKEVTVRADEVEFTVRVRIDTPKEVQYYQHGGILPFVLRQLLAS